MKSIEIFDSTLRDGAQGEGIQFSLVDKIAIANALDRLGIKYIEAGNPSSNKKDLAFFNQNNSFKTSKLVAFGATKRCNSTSQNDVNLQSLLSSNCDLITIFGKSWDLHVLEVLRTTLDENLAMITDSILFLKQHGKKVFFDAEHFFDGFKNNSDYALKVLDAAVKGGADCLVLCDTNGGAFPDEIFDTTKLVCKKFNISIGIHCHNDGGNASANSIMAVKAGATHVQGTFTGFGERCGNASLCTIIPNLQVKLGYKCIPDECMPLLSETANIINEIANVTHNPSAPYVGSSAFAHKAGMHIDGVTKLSNSFEHISPETVGNKRRFLMSEVAGRGAILHMIQKITPDLNKESAEVLILVEKLKQLESEGYQFESAEASFEIMIRKHLKLYNSFFELVHYRILNEQDTTSALIKIRVDGKEEITAAEGEGPVHAMDCALRKAIEVFYPELKKMHLIDYKVRVLESKDATAAKVRVLIQSADCGDIWTTVGVSTNIIEASWKALADSIEYKLIKDTHGCLKMPKDA